MSACPRRKLNRTYEHHAIALSISQLRSFRLGSRRVDIAFLLHASLSEEPINALACPGSRLVSRSCKIGGKGSAALTEDRVRPLIGPGPRTNRKFDASVFHGEPPVSVLSRALIVALTTPISHDFPNPSPGGPLRSRSATHMCNNAQPIIQLS